MLSAIPGEWTIHITLPDGVVTQLRGSSAPGKPFRWSLRSRLPMLSRVAETIRRHRMFEPGQHVGVAVSAAPIRSGIRRR